MKLLERLENQILSFYYSKIGRKCQLFIRFARRKNTLLHKKVRGSWPLPPPHPPIGGVRGTVDQMITQHLSNFLAPLLSSTFILLQTAFLSSSIYLLVFLSKRKTVIHNTLLAVNPATQQPHSWRAVFLLFSSILIISDVQSILKRHILGAAETMEVTLLSEVDYSTQSVQ